MPLMQNTLEMSTLLNVAPRVEAAVESYLSVQEFADKQLWNTGFNRELVCTHIHGTSFDHSTFELANCFP